MATYYIDYNATDDSGAATKGDPWKRCPGMVGFGGSYSHSAGDVFVFKGGVTWPAAALPLTVGYSGTSGNEDEYTVDETWYTGGSYTEPVFDADQTDTNCIYGANKDYVIIDGIQLKDAKPLTGWQESDLYTYGCDNWTLRNCSFYCPVARAVYPEESDNMTVEKCYFDTTVINNAYQNDIFIVWGCDGFVLQDSILYMRKLGGYYIDGLQTYGCSNMTVRRNYFIMPDGYGTDDDMLINIEANTGNTYVYNNVIYNGTDNNWESFVWLSPGTLYAYNNTIVNLGGNVGYPFLQESGFTDVYFKNNICVANGAACIYLGGAVTTSKVDYNLLYQLSGTTVGHRGDSRTWSAWQGLGYDVNGVNADPKFTSEYDDLTLQSDSPAVDVADDTIGATYENALDPDSSWPDSVATLDQGSYGDGWEIGAYVYETEESSSKFVMMM